MILSFFWLGFILSIAFAVWLSFFRLSWSTIDYSPSELEYKRILAIKFFVWILFYKLICILFRHEIDNHRHCVIFSRFNRLSVLSFEERLYVDDLLSLCQFLQSIKNYQNIVQGNIRDESSGADGIALNYQLLFCPWVISSSFSSIVGSIPAIVSSIVSWSISAIVIPVGISEIASLSSVLLSLLGSLLVLSFPVVLNHSVQVNFFVAHSLLINSKKYQIVKSAKLYLRNWKI